jgi:ribonuclease P protein component
LGFSNVDASGFRFARSSRLLTPADFKQVFDAAALKISSKEVLILARTNRHADPRLGLVIAKKHVRQANQRNRVKRIVRESFRHQLNLGGWDVIVLARGGIAQFDNPTLRIQLDQLWQQFVRKATKLRDIKPC